MPSRKVSLKIMLLIASILFAPICGYLAVTEWLLGDSYGTAGPYSDNYPSLVLAVREYARDHDGTLPEPGSLSDALLPYLPSEKHLYANFRVDEKSCFRALEWQDEYGSGILVYWGKREFGPKWRSKFSHGLVVYEGAQSGRVVKLYRLPSEKGFSEEFVRPMRLRSLYGLAPPST